MVKDAESHADEDRKFHELVNARNQADNMIHATQKSLKDLGDKVDAEEKSKVETAIADLQEALKNDDKDLIESKTQALAEASAKIAERVYAQQQEAQGEAASSATTEKTGATGESDKENVVDAEFEEVKEDNK